MIQGMSIEKNLHGNATARTLRDFDAAKVRKRILFVGEAVTLAHVVRPLVLAQALDSERYAIEFASGERYRSIIEAAGFRFHALPTLDPKLFMRRLELGQALYDRKTLEQYVTAERALLDWHRPDLVIGDFRVSLSISAERARIPFANLCNAHWSPYSTLRFPTPELPVTRLMGPGLAGRILSCVAPLAFRLQARDYNAVRKANELAPVDNLREMYTRGDWTLYLDLPKLAPTRNLPAQHRYLGPVTWSPLTPMPEGWRRDGRPLLYVTLGSSGDGRALTALLQALGRMPVQVALATAGRSLPVPIPENVFVAEYLPAPEILRQAEVCIFNGGAATGYQALAAGVPVLGLPSNADQFYFMEAVARAGAGKLVRPSQATAGLLAVELEALLRNREWRASAQVLGREVTAYPATLNFRRWVEEWRYGASKKLEMTNIQHSSE